MCIEEKPKHVPPGHTDQQFQSGAVFVCSVTIVEPKTGLNIEEISIRRGFRVSGDDLLLGRNDLGMWSEFQSGAVLVCPGTASEMSGGLSWANGCP